jgi:hypothetical protein
LHPPIFRARPLISSTFFVSHQNDWLSFRAGLGLEPILPLLTLQLQRLRCSLLKRFYIGETYF